MFQSDIIPSIQIALGENNIAAESNAWAAHATFKGVFLKHLVTGKENGGLSSFHLVKVDPGCSLGQHVHAGKWEFHEVIQGEGEAEVGGRTIHYVPGQMALIPTDTPHQVMAGDSGLLLMAVFFPALL